MPEVVALVKAWAVIVGEVVVVHSGEGGVHCPNSDVVFYVAWRSEEGVAQIVPMKVTLQGAHIGSAVAGGVLSCLSQCVWKWNAKKTATGVLE